MNQRSEGANVEVGQHLIGRSALDLFIFMLGPVLESCIPVSSKRIFYIMLKMCVVQHDVLLIIQNV